MDLETVSKLVGTFKKFGPVGAAAQAVEKKLDVLKKEQAKLNAEQMAKDIEHLVDGGFVKIVE